MGLLSTREQNVSIVTIAPAMQRLRAQYPLAGTREIIGLLEKEENIRAPRYAAIGFLIPTLITTRQIGDNVLFCNIRSGFG